MRSPEIKNRTWLVFPFLAFATVLMDCSCDFFGTTGGLFVPEAKEKELGTSFDSTLRNTDSGRAEFPIYNPGTDPNKLAFQAYVTDLAKNVLAQVPAGDMPDYPFTFTIIDKDVQNAFAVPGGFVYIYTGIIKDMQDESELAGVLGHEISHVVWHHYRDALAKTAGMGILLDALLGDDAGKLAQLVAGSLFQLAALKVSRSNEAEADHYGTIYTGKAGRNPLGIAKYFSRVQSLAPAWISSHPDPGDRVKEVQAQVNADATLRTLAADSSRNFTADFIAKTAVIR
jgi:beta-barrel assembly-enhancing protease